MTGSPEPLRNRLGPRAWALSCTLFITTSIVVWVALASGLAAPWLLTLPGELWLAVPWTLWTAPLVHFVLPHALAHWLALAALAAAGTLLPVQPRDALALLLAWPLSTAALLLWPQIDGYYGLASIAHAATAILAVRAFAHAETYRLGQLVGTALLLKLALERGWEIPVGFESSWGTNIVFAAHLTGTAAGAASALALEAFSACSGKRIEPRSGQA